MERTHVLHPRGTSMDSRQTNKVTLGWDRLHMIESFTGE